MAATKRKLAPVRYCVIVSLLFLLGQSGTKQETPAQHKSDATQIAQPRIIPVTEQPVPSEQKNKPEQQPPKCPLPKWTDPFWPNWALVIVTLLAVWAAFRTLKDLQEQTTQTKATAEEAKQAAIFSRDATKESQRADVLIESFSLATGNQNWKLNADAKVVVSFRNFGRTRAKDVRIRIDLTIPGMTIAKGRRELPVMVLGAGQSQSIATETFHDCLTIPTTVQVINGKLELQCTSSASYDDVFGSGYAVFDIRVFDPHIGDFKIVQKIA